MKSIYKILGIIMILAVVSLSGCIGEDVTVDEGSDVVIEDVLVNDSSEEPIADESDDAVGPVDPVDEEDGIEEVEYDNGNQRAGAGGDGKDGDYSSEEYFAGIRDDAQTAYNAAQALVGEANVTMIAADEEVLRCQASVDEGNGLPGVAAAALEALNITNVTTLTAFELIVPAQTNVTNAENIAVYSMNLTTSALEILDSTLADVNSTEGAKELANATYTTAKAQSDSDAAEVLILVGILEERQQYLIDAQDEEEDALEAYDAAVEAVNSYTVVESEARAATVVVAQGNADSARSTFEALMGVVDVKLAALEAAQDKLDSVVE